MKYLFTLFCLLFSFANADAQAIYQRKYGTATTVNFSLWKLDATGLKVDAADGGTDCSIIKDEGSQSTCTNDFSDEGSSYSLALTATEMQAARVVLHIVDQSDPQVFLDKVILLETYGDTTSAQYPNGTYATAQAATSTSLQLAAAEAYANDELNDNTAIHIVSASTGAGQIRCITDYVGSTDTATVATWTTTPTGTIIYELLPAPGCTSGGGSDAATIWAYSSRTLTDKTGFALSGSQTFDLTGSISGSVGSVTTVNDKSGYSAACTLGTDVVTAASISSGAGNKIADMVLRRNTSNVEASSYGDTIDRKSLLGATAQQTHRITIVGDTLTTYRSDGTTVLGARTVTSSSSAAPITGIGN